MKSYLSFAWKELKAQKITAVLILIAILLSTIMTTALGQSLGILQSMRVDQASGLNGDRYATFHQLTEEQIQTLSKDDRLLDVGSLITVGNVKLENSGLTLFLREFQDDALKAYPSSGQIQEGRLPKAPNEIALPEDTLQYLPGDVKVGDQITLDAQISLLKDEQTPHEYSATYTITGILKSSYIGYVTGTIMGVVGEGTAELILPDRYMLYSTDFKTRSLEKFQSIIYDLAKELNVQEEYIQYNWVLLDALRIQYDGDDGADTESGFSFMAAACVLVGILVLLAAGLVIYNILKIAVTKRIRGYGTLRAVGGEKGQIYRLVALQLLILCGIGIPIGLIGGVLSAKWLLIAATGILNPDLFLAESTIELNAAISSAGTGNVAFLFLSVGISLAFAMIAAFPAARYAASVSPTMAMSGEAVKVKRHGRKRKRIRNFEAYYARLNLKRSRGRTVITILSLVMSITVFVALQSFSSILDTSKSVQDMHLGDYAVSGGKTGLDADAVSQLSKQEAVRQMAATKLSVYMQDKDGTLPIPLGVSLKPWESFQIAGIDEARLSSYLGGLSEQDLQDLLQGKACLLKGAIPFSADGKEVVGTQFDVGDTITVNGRAVRIVGITEDAVTVNNEGFTNGVQLIVSNQLYEELTGQNRYSEIYPILEDNADADAFEGWLDEWCKSNAGSHWLSYENVDSELAESFEQINLLCWGLILFIGLIGILNIINTVYSNIHTRIAEIGMQRAIGMSRRSLYKTFLWEGGYYAIIASVIGAVAGYLCTIFIHAATTDTLQFAVVPFLSIIEAAAISIIACLAATAVPLYSISKMNIVESIEAVE